MTGILKRFWFLGELNKAKTGNGTHRTEPALPPSVPPRCARSRCAARPTTTRRSRQHRQGRKRKAEEARRERESARARARQARTHSTQAAARAAGWLRPNPTRPPAPRPFPLFPSSLSHHRPPLPFLVSAPFPFPRSPPRFPLLPPPPPQFG